MITPLKIEFEVGKTRHNQTVKLIREHQSNGVPTWTIQKIAADQRDETDTIRGLDETTILRMAEAVTNFPGRK